jgi:hypothetical protein
MGSMNAVYALLRPLEDGGLRRDLPSGALSLWGRGLVVVFVSLVESVRLAQ